MGSDEIHWLSATEAAVKLRAGELSSVELTTACLERIDETNGSLNAIVTLTADLALERARQADDAHAAGESRGVLHGLPIVHKDLADTAGIRTTRGSPILAEHVPEADALVVERSVGAGAVTVGKSNTPEFGMGSQTFNRVFGMTRNPYDTSKTCGGSSGGAAVALAAGMVPLADGSDMGGSLRNPASFCNVVGFRPSPGRVPAWPKATPWSPLSTEGPMGRTVDDVALLLSAQAGPDLRSPIALETPGSAFAPPVAMPDASLRVAWAPDLGGLPIDPAVTEALASSPGIFEELGHHVTLGAPDLSGADEIFDVLRAFSFALILEEPYRTSADLMKETARWQVQRGLDLSIDDHRRASAMHAQLFERVIEFFGDYDVLLCPVAQVPPFDTETEFITEVAGQEMSTYIEWMRVCTDVTLMHCPAISVPAGFTTDGLPIGLQIVGRPRADQQVLQVARQFEAATNVGRRRPAI